MRRLTIEEMKRIANERGGRCLSDTYEGYQKKLKWECSKGHVWEATPLNVKHRNRWCPICARLKHFDRKSTALNTH